MNDGTLLTRKHMYNFRTVFPLALTQSLANKKTLILENMQNNKNNNDNNNNNNNKNLKVFFRDLLSLV